VRQPPGRYVPVASWAFQSDNDLVTDYLLGTHLNFRVSRDAKADERQSAHIALRRWHDDKQRAYTKKPERRPNGLSAGR
jgi:hypothetical protein